MDTSHTLTNNSNPWTTTKNLEEYNTLIGAELGAAAEEMSVVLRHDMKGVSVTLRG